MRALIQYEIRKMLTDSAAKYLCALLIGLITFNIYTVISKYSCGITDFSFDRFFTGRRYYGLKAVQEVKKRYRNYTADYSEFSVKNLRAAYNAKKKLNEDFAKKAAEEGAQWSAVLRNELMERNSAKLDEVYPSRLQAFLSLVSAGIDKSEPVEQAVPDNMYEMLFDIRAYQTAATESESEQQLLRQKCDELSVPFRFGYCEGWSWLSLSMEKLLKWLPALMMAFFMLILKYENESGMEELSFTTRYGRTKGVYAKIIAGVGAAVLFYTAASVIYAAGIFSILGVEGGIYPVQILPVSFYFGMPVYSINLIQCCLLQYFLGLLVTVSAVLALFFAFSLFRNYVSAFVISLIMYYGINLFSKLLPSMSDSPLQKYIEGIGVNALNMVHNFCGLIQNGDFIWFFGIPVLRMYGLIIIYAGLSFMLAVLTMYRYGRCKVR